MNKSGTAYLIGAGPGDPGLLTTKGKEIVEIADVIIYDALVNKEILSYGKKDCELIYVGKRIGNKELRQFEINSLILDKCKENKIVVRLKGGDPFIFGRGGEEAEFLSKNGISFEIVPGVSSITAVFAYCGIPLTHREYNSSFAVFTGHLEKFNTEDKETLKSLTEIDTLVFVMGLFNLENVIYNLLKAGRDPDTPILIASKGTLPEQKSLRGTISNIVQKLEKHKEIITPAIIIVGEVVKLKDQINWYENKPLFGKRIIITRDNNYNQRFAKLLYNEGATIFEFPTIEISRIKDNPELDESINNIDKYSYIIFTSVNGVKYFFKRLGELGKDSREFKNKQIITIGSKTNQELSKYNLNADLTPFEYVAEGIINLVKDIDLKNKNILIPRAKIARDVLPDELEKMGAKVDVIPTYETLIPEYNNDKLESILEILTDDDETVITFTSSSTVSNFFSLIGDNSEKLNKIKFAAIGPITAKTLEEKGFPADIIADKYTIEGLTEKILKYYK